MFAESGIKSIRMDDIARTLAVSKRTLYEMFADKEELLYLCIRHLQDRRSERAERIFEQYLDNIAGIFEVMQMMMNDADHVMPRLISNLRKFYPNVYTRISEEVKEESGRRLYCIIKHYAERGLISPHIDLRLAVAMLYYTTTTLAASMDNISLPASVNAKSALTYTIINSFRGMATIEGIRQIDAYFAERKERKAAQDHPEEKNVRDII